MEREELPQQISGNSGIAKEDVRRVYEGMAECMIDALSKGDNVVMMPDGKTADHIHEKD